jgi:hypothetical protein
MPNYDTADASVIATFGEDVTYTPFGSGSAVVVGFFQAPDDEPDTTDLNFIAISPQVTLTDTDAPSPNKGDLFTIRGVDYTVKDFEDDESSLVVFFLLET